MPFKSDKQRRYLFANEPEIAKRWSNMYNKIKGLGGTKSKDIEKAKKEYYSIIKYLKKRNIPFIVKEINKGRKIPIHQRDIKIVGKPNIRMIDILQIMKGEDVILGLGVVKKQGYKDREDESIAMRRGKEKGKKQSYKDRRNESYGKFGKRDKEKRGKNKINITGLGAVKPTIYEIKRMTFDKLPYFFDKNTMKFYGQRLSDFKVKRSPKGKIYIYARIAKDEGGGYSFHEFKNNDLKPIPTFFDTLDKVKKYISKN